MLLWTILVQHNANVALLYWLLFLVISIKLQSFLLGSSHSPPPVFPVSWGKLRYIRKLWMCILDSNGMLQPVIMTNQVKCSLPMCTNKHVEDIYHYDMELNILYIDVLEAYNFMCVRYLYRLGCSLCCCIVNTLYVSELSIIKKLLLYLKYDRYMICLKINII